MGNIISVLGYTPEIDPSVFIAPNAYIIGNVKIGKQSSVWFNVTIRGDVHAINIGAESNIQDGAVIHCTYQKAATQIGDRVTVGHSAVIHGCTLKDECLIGMRAIILDHAIVEEKVIVAAGALVLEKSILESGYLYAGVPAKKIKMLSQEQMDGIRTYAEHYKMYQQWYDFKK